MGLGYVRSDEQVNAEWLEGQSWQIDIGGQLFDASASLRAAYDPDGANMR